MRVEVFKDNLQQLQDLNANSSDMIVRTSSVFARADLCIARGDLTQTVHYYRLALMSSST
jgi:hypothetical protein